MSFFNTRIVLLLAMFATIWVSCDTDKRLDIMGKWRYAQWNLAGQEIDLAGLGNPVINFKEDNSFTVAYGVRENTEKWHLASDTLVMEYKDGHSQQFLIKQLGNDSIKLQSHNTDLDAQILLVRIKE